MKLDLRENMYVRTKDGIIDKILKLNKSYVKGVSQKDELYAYDIDNIVKASYNIIDILEKGDYVNGYLVTYVYKPDGNEVFRIEIERDTLKGHIIDKSSQIKSIVTKEQMEKMEYKVEE